MEEKKARPSSSSSCEILLGGWSYGADKAAPLEVKRLEWAGRWLFALDSDQILHRIDTTDMKTTDTPIGSGNDNSVPELSFSVTRDGKWLAWMENRKLLVLADVESGARRGIPLEVYSSIQTSDEGIRIFASDGTRLLLRSEDLAAGFPVQVVQPTPEWSARFTEGRTHPRWDGLLDTGSGHTERTKQGNRDAVSIPAGRCYDFARDGTIYYVNSNGVVVLVTP